MAFLAFPDATLWSEFQRDPYHRSRGEKHQEKKRPLTYILLKTSGKISPFCRKTPCLLHNYVIMYIIPMLLLLREYSKFHSTQGRRRALCRKKSAKGRHITNMRGAFRIIEFAWNLLLAKLPALFVRAHRGEPGFLTNTFSSRSKVRHDNLINWCIFIKRREERFLPSSDALLNYSLPEAQITIINARTLPHGAPI